MRGYLILGLLGEQVARSLVSHGVRADAAATWLEGWSNAILCAIHAPAGNAEAIAASLYYRLAAAQGLVEAEDGVSDAG